MGENMKRAIAILLSATIMLSTSVCTIAYAGEDNSVEQIHLDTTDKADIEMNELSLPGESKLCIVADSQSDYDIVVNESNISSLNDAIVVLQDAIEIISGARLNIVTIGEADYSKPNIYIGVVDGAELSEDRLADGFALSISNAGIYITGATEDGTRNGIYTFVEEKLGVIFMTPSSTYYPTQSSIYLDFCNEEQKPATLWRDVYAYETVQNGWAGSLKLNGINIEGMDAENPVEELQYNGWGSWCHNCYQYLSPDDYYDTHPEYFSEKNGKRITSYADRDAYLCLSNPEVYDIVEKALAKKIEENPQQLYWDFSGNDNPALAGCECKKCKELDKKAGGTGMGTLLPFLNKLAKAFPDKYISTLAYLHTLKAPVGIKAEPNVVIKLCAMPGDQASSYMNGRTDGSKQFKEQIEQWSKITDKIVVWDYVVDFAHLLMPFPNFAVQKQNQKFYEDNGIIGIFHQASRENGGELANLRAYALAHLMWYGSDFDIEKCISKYVTAYWNDSAPYVIEYLNLCANELYESNMPLGLYDGLMPHRNGYLSQDNIAKMNDIIKNARDAVADDEYTQDRLDEIELPIAYANAISPYTSSEDRNAYIDRVNELCEKRGITMVCEWESLESFNNDGLDSLIKGEKKEIHKPAIIIASAFGGAFAVGIISGVVINIVKRRKKK